VSFVRAEGEIAVINAGGLKGGGKSRLLPSEEFVIALHSPDGVIETGVHIRPPEKIAAELAPPSSAERFLQSGFGARIAELWRFRATFRGMQPSFLCASDWVAERDGFELSVQLLTMPLRAYFVSDIQRFHLRNARIGESHWARQKIK